MNATDYNWLAALATGLLLLAVLVKWGHNLPRSVKLDDFARVFVAVFGVAGPLYVTPRFHGWAQDIRDFFTSGAHGLTISPSLITLLAAGIFIVAAWFYLSGPSLGRLALLVLVTLPLFSNNTMLTVAQWWVDNPGSWIFRAVINGLNAIAGY